MFLNSKYSLYQSVVRKLDDIRSMNEEERKFYNKYFGEENMYYGSDTRKEAANGFWREEYDDIYVGGRSKSSCRRVRP